MKHVATILRDASHSNPDAVEKARELLESCERGEVIGFAVAGVMKDGFVTTGFTTSGHAMKILGALELLKMRILEWFNDE